MSRMKEAKAALLDRLPDIVRELAPGGTVSGGVYTTKNPARPDRHAGSFVIWLRGPGSGAFKDYSSGQKGDVIGLVQLAKSCDRKAALAWAEDRCGIRHMSGAERAAIVEKAKARRDDGAERERHDEARRVDRARNLFARAERDGLSAMPVARYLDGRGIETGGLYSFEDGFRFIPDLEHWMSPRPRPRFPALVSAMVDAAGILQGVHCTFLASDGSGKAKVDKPKLMFPRVRGLVIRVSRGQGNRNAETAAEGGQAGPLVISEGVENALSAAYACPELRVWAAASLAGLLNLPDHACADSFVVVRDNDWGDQARATLDRAVARLETFGKPVRVVAATGAAKDVNDLLRERTAA